MLRTAKMIEMPDERKNLEFGYVLLMILLECNVFSKIISYLGLL